MPSIMYIGRSYGAALHIPSQRHFASSEEVLIGQCLVKGHFITSECSDQRCSPHISLSFILPPWPRSQLPHLPGFRHSPFISLCIWTIPCWNTARIPWLYLFDHRYWSCEVVSGACSTVGCVPKRGCGVLNLKALQGRTFHSSALLLGRAFNYYRGSFTEYPVMSDGFLMQV